MELNGETKQEAMWFYTKESSAPSTEFLYYVATLDNTT